MVKMGNCATFVLLSLKLPIEWRGVYICHGCDDLHQSAAKIILAVAFGTQLIHFFLIYTLNFLGLAFGCLPLSTLSKSYRCTKVL